MDATRIENLKGTDPAPADMGLDDFVDHVRGLASPTCPVCRTAEASPDGSPCLECADKGRRDPLGIHNFWRSLASRLGI